uniref:Peptidase S26 domain-containing protein n=1 Tax=Kalanchoe fedtschenkoi TaxID=63787 RepID=A0A7N0SWG0_KALFE
MAVRDFGRFLWQNFREFSRDAIDPVMHVARFFCFLHITSTRLVTPVRSEGPSMLPTINLTGDYVLAEKISARLGTVRPGDIVLIRSPQNPRNIVTKRVTAVEGQRVNFVAKPKESDLCAERSCVDRG